MRKWSVLIVAGIVALVLGCGDDETPGEIAEMCPGDECVECDGHVDCPPATYCHGEGEVCVGVECDGDEDCEDDDTRCHDGKGVCVGEVCEPGDTHCDEASVVRCNHDGTGYLDPAPCESGVCEAGQCGCENESDCAPGEVCEDGGCSCPSNVRCGDDGTCCGEGEICSETELCDDGDCTVFYECQPECAGEFCGFDGQLCCDGDEPVCGPDGACAPDCGGDSQLCGDDFDECCEADEVCVFGDCRRPGDDCEDFRDCGVGEYCDRALGRCMPDEFPDDVDCEADLDINPFDIEELWRFEGVELGDRLYRNVQSIPVTADMTGDGTPEVVITPYHGGDQHNGILAVVDGVTGETVYYNDQRTFSGQGHSAVVDITGDGRPEIVSVLGEGDAGLAMIENPQNCSDPEVDDDDCIAWEFRDGLITSYEDAHGMGPLFADLNGDGDVEIVHGSTVIDAETGELLAEGRADSRGYNGPHGSWGAPTVVDLDGDNTLEVVTGDCAWKVDLEDGEFEEVWCTDEFDDGMPAVADVVASGGRQGQPEVVTVRSGTVYVLDGQDGELLYSIDVPGGGQGGPPNIADFDGDGTVEIGLPGEQCYSVFDLDCLEESEEPGECDQPEFPDCTPGEDCLVDPCNAPGLTDGSGDGVLWSIEVQDRSEATGSSVFDFQGNGRNEVVYNDECRLLVLDGQTGQPHIAKLNTTRTATEYPLVVDVNGDGRSNIAMIANNDQYDRDCDHFLDPDSSDRRPDWFPECFPDDIDDRPEECDVGTSGVVAIQDVHDAWVSTRSIWNQHAYHIDNIDDDATLPDEWADHWQTHNTFRANQQGEIPTNIPDIAVTALQVNALGCPPSIELQATVENQGIASIPAGMPVTLYVYDGGGDPVPVETRELDEPISPGGVLQVEFSYSIGSGQINEELDFQVIANDDGTGEAPVPDCNPQKAMALVEDVVCSFEL